MHNLNNLWSVLFLILGDCIHRSSSGVFRSQRSSMFWGLCLLRAHQNFRPKSPRYPSEKWESIFIRFRTPFSLMTPPCPLSIRLEKKSDWIYVVMWMCRYNQVKMKANCTEILHPTASLLWLSSLNLDQRFLTIPMETGAQV